MAWQQDAVEGTKVIAGVAAGGGLLKALQWRSQNRLTTAQAEVQEATADATSASSQAKVLEAAATAVGLMVPHLMKQLEDLGVRFDRQATELAEVRGEVLRLMAQGVEGRVQQATELAEVRGEVLRLMAQGTEDRIQIDTLSAELAVERIRAAQVGAWCAAIQEWAGDAVREIRRLDGTISDPPTLPIDPPAPPMPGPRPPSD